MLFFIANSLVTLSYSRFVVVSGSIGLPHSVRVRSHDRLEVVRKYLRMEGRVDVVGRPDSYGKPRRNSPHQTMTLIVLLGPTIILSCFVFMKVSALGSSIIDLFTVLVP